MSEQNELTEPDVAAHPVEPDKEQAWHEWMGIAVGLTALCSILAMILAVVALSSSTPGATAQAATMAMPTPSALGATSAPLSKPEAVKLLVKTDVEHGRRGPDGKWHDAFLPGDFTVHPGDTVTVTVENYDSSPHTFTAPSMGVNAIIPGGGSVSSPHETTFTFTAPKTAGKYQWWCSIPCDPWAMAHDGYMRGFVTVAA
jgi:plastocyanin